MRLKVAQTGWSAVDYNLRLVLVLNLIGWESGARFLRQSHSEVKQNQSNWKFLLRVNVLKNQKVLSRININ